MENLPSRFTLRKEYFGGLVYDSAKAKVELLQPHEYDLLTKLALAEEQIFESQLQTNPELAHKFSVFRKAGFVDIHEDGQLTLTSVRIIPTSESPLQESLTAPIRVFDSITKYCNFDCSQCYFSAGNQVGEQKRTLEQTVDIMQKFSSVGTMEWKITGGEPTTDPNLFGMISAGKKIGMNVGIYTNGWWSEKTAKKILDSNLNEIVISIEGTRETNDKRRKSGAFVNAVKTLERIQEYNRSKIDNKIDVVIASAIGRDNINDIEFLVKLAAKYGADINFMPLKPSGRARNLLTEQCLTSGEYMKFAEKVQRMRELPEIRSSEIKIIMKYKDLFCNDYQDKSNLPYPFNYSECGALTTAVSMLPDGRVYSCPFVLDVDLSGEFMGPNMINSSVNEAWSCLNFEKYSAATKIGCADCEFYMKQCRGACRATVLGCGGKISNNKLIGNDPQCFAANLKSQHKLLI